MFGPRASGKSWLIRHQLADARQYNLLDPRTYARLLQHPEAIGEDAGAELVVIDEVQKLPSLLDEVHRLIEERGARFLLTGSSARKLRRGNANMLASRAWIAEMFPLVTAEIPNFDLPTYLTRGGLPSVLTSADYEEDLHAYCATYLQEEIRAEALTRHIDAFARFLTVLALCNGQLVDYAGLSRDTAIQAKTIRNYVEIAKDTLIAFEVPAFRKSVTRKAVASSKLFLFDIGVVGTLAKRGPVAEGSELFGRAFEHFIALELRAYLSYRRKRLELMHWRSHSQMEVDFLIGEHLAIEVKSTTHVTSADLKGLRALREEGLVKEFAAVSRDPVKRTLDGITIWPWREFLSELWADRIPLSGTGP